MAFVTFITFINEQPLTCRQYRNRRKFLWLRWYQNRAAQMPPKAPAAVAPIKVDAASEEGAAGNCHYRPPSNFEPKFFRVTLTPTQACFVPLQPASKPPQNLQIPPSSCRPAHTQRRSLLRQVLISAAMARATSLSSARAATRSPS